MNLSIDPKLILFLAIISLIFVDIGILVSGYKITFAFFFLLASIFFMKLSLNCVLAVLLYGAVTFISGLGILDTLMLIKVGLVCLMMLSASCSAKIKLNQIDKEKTVRLFDHVFKLVFTLVSVEFFLANLFGLSIYDPSRLSVTYGSFVRPFFLFTEPSILSIYAVFSFIIFDVMWKSGHTNQSFALSKILCVVIVIYTVSFTGIVLLVAHNMIYVFQFLTRNLSLKTLRLILFRALLIFVATIALFWMFPSVFDKLYSRLLDMIFVLAALAQFDLTSINLNSSVGYRLVTLFSVVDYISHGTLWQILFGEGFLNFHSWVIERYSFLAGTGTILEDGDVTNLIAVIFLSGGLLGGALFFLYIIMLLRNVNKQERIFVFTFIIGFMLVYGGLTEPHFYLFTYILLFFFNKLSSHSVNSKLDIVSDQMSGSLVQIRR